jgi:hypothetical protein
MKQKNSKFSILVNLVNKVKNLKTYKETAKKSFSPKFTTYKENFYEKAQVFDKCLLEYSIIKSDFEYWRKIFEYLLYSKKQYQWSVQIPKEVEYS